MFEPVWFASFTQLALLYAVVITTLFYLLWKHGHSAFYVLIILLFYPALFSFVGKTFQDGYRIIVMLLAIWVSSDRLAFTPFKKGDDIFTIFFAIFSLLFITTTLSSGDNWTIVLSQFSRYVVAYCLWFLVRQEINQGPKHRTAFGQFVFELLFMQIVITLGKLFIFQGRQIEGLVGSLAYIGGADGTILPILGFISLWSYRHGILKRKDVYFIAGLMLTGFLAAKRAVWFIMPVVIFAFMIDISRIKLGRVALAGLVLAPIAFYLGVRLTPSLNPELKVWGKFNFDYAFNYAKIYQFGSKEDRNNLQYKGRGGATISLWDKLNSNERLSKKDWFGFGLRNIYSIDYNVFNNLNLSITHKGSASGIYQTYVATGYLGIFATLLLFFPLFWHVRMHRIRWVLLALVAWEYFLYTGLIFRTPAYMFLLFWFMHFSNYLAHRSMPSSQRISNIPVFR